ncbi:MAG: hypothetical protein IKV94_02180 [Clostridia bacterium]|nr:hypothetical protein [Clostridia bacterium]
MKKLSKVTLVLIILSIIILNTISYIFFRNIFLGESGILLILVFGFYIVIPLIILHFYANIKLSSIMLKNFNISKWFVIVIILLPIIFAYGSYKIAYDFEMKKYIETNYAQSYSILDKSIYSNEDGDYTVNYLLAFDNDKENPFIASYDIGGYYDRDEDRYYDNYKFVKRGKEILGDGYIDTVILDEKAAVMEERYDINSRYLILLLEVNSNMDSKDLTIKLQKIYNHYNNVEDLYMAVYFCNNIQNYAYERQCLTKVFVPNGVGTINKKYSQAIWINNTTSYYNIQSKIENVLININGN